MEWNIKKFAELSNDDLYDIMMQRAIVFVGEQQCLDPDLDGLDKHAMHCYLKDGETVAAYCRIIPAGAKYEQASIGRVLVDQRYRRQGMATELMKRAIAYITDEWREKVIKVQAQAHLEKFYNSLGFESVSDVYEDVGIPHIDMLRHS